MLHFHYIFVDKCIFFVYNEFIRLNLLILKFKFFDLRKTKELIIMNTKEYIPVPNNLSLTVRKEHRLMVIKRATRTTFRISLKTLLYALFLTVANILV